MKGKENAKSRSLIIFQEITSVLGSLTQKKMGRIYSVGKTTYAPERYCQLKPDLADWTWGAHSVFPDKSLRLSPGELCGQGGIFVKLTMPNRGYR